MKRKTDKITSSYYLTLQYILSLSHLSSSLCMYPHTHMHYTNGWKLTHVTGKSCMKYLTCIIASKGYVLAHQIFRHHFFSRNVFVFLQIGFFLNLLLWCRNVLKKIGAERSIEPKHPGTIIVCMSFHVQSINQSAH